MIKDVIAVTDNDKVEREIEIAVFEEAGFDVPWLDCHSEEDVINNCKGFKVLVNQYAPFTKRVFENLPDLKVIVRYGVGVDNVDLKAATEHGVSVCNVPDYGTSEVADHAVALTLALARRVVLNNELIKSGKWLFEASKPLHRFSTQTVGVIGLGRIGLSYAKKMSALGFNIIGTNAVPLTVSPENDFVRQVTFDELISSSDIISIHCPLDGNRDLITKSVFKNMKNNAIVINVSRGGIINEDDLYEALTNGEIYAAGCDVATKEPMPAESPLLTLQNFIITPHIAWYSEEGCVDLKRKTAEEAVRGGKGEQLRNVVNK